MTLANQWQLFTSLNLDIDMKTPEKVVVNNLLFALVDVIECLMLDAEKLYRKDGQEFKHQSKSDFNKTLFYLRRFLSSIRECSTETQIQ